MALLACALLAAWAAHWQWQRAGLHETLAAQTAAQLQSPAQALSLSALQNPNPAQRYRITGQFKPQGHFALGPRSHDSGKQGALVYGAFAVNVEGDIKTLLVQRGWTAWRNPAQNNLSELKLNLDTAAPETLDVVWQPTLAQALSLKATPFKLGEINAQFDPAAYAAQLGLTNGLISGVWLQQSPTQAALEPTTISNQSLLAKAAKNRGYALQWLLLCLVASLGLLLLIYKTLKQK